MMRLAPVPMFYARHPREAIDRAGESSKTTHGTAVCIDACRYFGGLIVGALAGALKGCLLAVNLGDDADTTGAVYGQLAGAYYGEEGISDSWRDKLALRDQIGAYPKQLHFSNVSQDLSNHDHLRLHALAFNALFPTFPGQSKIRHLGTSPDVCHSKIQWSHFFLLYLFTG